MFGQSHTQIRDLAFLGDHEPVLREERYPQKSRRMCGELVKETLRYDRVIKRTLTTCPSLRPLSPFPPYLLWLAAGVHGDKEDLHDPLVGHRQWDTEVAEGVEGHRHVATIRAHHRGLEEAMESVHNHRIVPPFVVLPGLLSNLLLSVMVGGEACPGPGKTMVWGGCAWD